MEKIQIAYVISFRWRDRLLQLNSSSLWAYVLMPFNTIGAPSAGNIGRD